MRYCPHCKRNVRGVKRIGTLSWLLIIVCSGFTFGLFLVFWLPYFFLVKPYTCPICYAKDLQKAVPATG